MEKFSSRRWRAIVLTAASALVLGACATRAPETAPSADASGAGAGTAAGQAPRSDVAAASPSSAPSANAGSAVASRGAMPGERSVFFEFDSSAVTDDGRRVIARNADYLAGDRRAIRLEGNADERGSREYNLALGQRRADAVRQMLVLRGLAAASIESVSNGEERPRCAEHTEDCHASNRRVDFVYSR